MPPASARFGPRSALLAPAALCVALGSAPRSATAEPERDAKANADILRTFKERLKVSADPIPLETEAKPLRG